MTTQAKILVVDDEPVNLEIINEHLEDEGYQVETAQSGEQALTVLSEDNGFDLILLDRMMPGIDGIEVLKQIKASHKLRDIPVIMQTAATSAEQVSEGIASGAFYYLTKPFKPEILLAIVRSALDQVYTYRELKEEARQARDTMRLLRHGHFVFQTIIEARELASLISGAFPDPGKVVMGLSELMINAVEHGNLGVSYDGKSRLLQTNTWEEEVQRIQALPENRNKYAEVCFQIEGNKYTVLIRDQGKGFDWQPFMELHTERAYDTHGRGIAMARLMSFDAVEYQGRGNEVMATFFDKPDN
jgi:CheY-like chemotaxis protein/anti-sigma regulatory factor (Ser/Thr protein kinase)